MFHPLSQLEGFLEPEIQNQDMENISLPHTCPRCGITAYTLPQLEELFGYRNVPRGSDGQKRITVVHSWCRECRKLSAKKHA